MDLITLVMRWLHIGGATILIGSPFFIRLFLLPALAGEDPEHRAAIIERINKPWRMILGMVILLQIISGVYWLLVVVHMPAEPPLYQILLTIKLLAALGLFFLLSVLAGRAMMFAPFRAEAKKWYTASLICGAIIVMCAGAMRLMPLKQQSKGLPSVGAVRAAATNGP
ncbi:MAG: hypothetical protein ACYCUV_02895 [Phycisphaerae bacterium]